MKLTHTTKNFPPCSVSALHSDLLFCVGIANKLYKNFITLKQNAMKTILPLLAIMFIHATSFSQVSSFSARLKNDKINLSWTTRGETDISHFYVEKSYDGKSFKQVGVVFTLIMIQKL